MLALPRPSLIPILGEIVPTRIQSRDQCIFLFASPALQLLFPSDGIANLSVMLEVNQMPALIALRETGRSFAVPVLPYANP